jgi:hypothetical protein
MTDPQNADDTLTALQEAIDHGSDRRTPLFRWMLKNHDLFSDMLAGKRPNWKRLASTFAQYGLAGPDGQPLQPASVRLTWFRVRRSRGKQGKPAVLAPAPPTVLAPVTTVARTEVTRAETPVSPAPAKDANAALADVLAEMNRRSGRF